MVAVAQPFRKPADDLIPSSRSNPCPICSRTKDGDCRISDALVLCARGATHHPPANLRSGDVITGSDGQSWAYTSDTSDGRAATFTLDKPRTSQARPAVRPAPAIQWAVLPSPAPLPPARWPDGKELTYANGLVVKLKVGANGDKRHIPTHRNAKGCITYKAGPDHWPLWRQADAITHGGSRWIIETEGEKCAEWFAAGGLVAVSQPGHAMKPDAIERRYHDLLDAGVAGVAYLADNDDEGKRKAKKVAAAADFVGLQLRVIHAVDVWPDIPAKGSIDDAPGSPAERCAAFQRAAVKVMAKPAAAGKGKPAPSEQNQQTAALPDGFRILGWCPDRARIYYQHSETGQIASIKPTATSGTLLHLAALEKWEASHPGERGVAWDSALSAVISAANKAGVFVVERTRGRGVWLDNNSVIWHLGDRLVVDGKPVKLIEQRSANHYPRLPALDINPMVEPLSDAEGTAILNAIKAMGWASPLDPIHLLGWVMLANVGGAIDKRPVLQNTSERGSGKTFVRERVLEPLLAGLAISRSGSTEAGIRQILKADALPVIIDESEGEDAHRRKGHLLLGRLSYDGSPCDRGTTHGQALSYAVRSGVALSGINATITNPADRSRTVVVSRQFLPVTTWQPVAQQIETLCTAATGARLLRRAVGNLLTLRSNVATFRRVVEAQLNGTAAARAGDTYGALLAGAHMLISTAVVDDAAALAWSDAIGWDAKKALGDDTEDDDTNEGKQCLTAILTHEEPWRLVAKERGSGRISIRELVTLAHCGAGDEMAEAQKLLGRRGIRWTDCGLVIANKAEPLAPILKGTRWRDGAHRARLLDIPGAESVGTYHFPASGTMRATRIPIAAIQGDETADL